MCRSFVFAGEKTGAFQHDVDVKILPGQLRRIALCQHLDAVAIDHHRIALYGDRAFEFAVDGIVAGEMSVGFRTAQIVDGNDLNLTGAPRFVQGTQNVPADAAIAVNGDANSHEAAPGRDDEENEDERSILLQGWSSGAIGARRPQPIAVASRPQLAENPIFNAAASPLSA